MSIDLNTAGKNKTGEQMLTVAIGKGRGFEESLHFINTSTSEAYGSFARGELPVYTDEVNNMRLVKVRNKDLPWLLAKGHIDVAIGSSVWFVEFSQVKLKLVREFPLLKCRLSVIAPRHLPVSSITSICSKFQTIAKQYIKDKKLSANLLVMEGCHEVALTLGMSDAIIDIIETGKTIERMKFVEVECIQHITHGLWIREEDVGRVEKRILQKEELRIS